MRPDTPTAPPRVLPGLVIASLLVSVRYLVPLVSPDAAGYGLLGGLALSLITLVWWLFFSRLPQRERWIGLGLVILAMVLTRLLVHPSIATGMMGLMLPIYALPMVCIALVLWVLLRSRLTPGMRGAALVLLVFGATGVWTLARTKGVTGTAGAELRWRWTDTAEERLLATLGDAPASRGSVTIQQIDWPGFRGNERNSVVTSSGLVTDWTTSPPEQLWRRPVGPGWSSFAIAGDVFYTQEQRGEEELVSFYRLSTGEPVWIHTDAIRFWESNAGAGPRATPTLHEGRILALGATGRLNVLEASDGSPVWSRDTAEDTRQETPIWGFAGSPIVVGENVVVASAGTLVAYDRSNGDLRWVGPDGGGGYGSPHLATIDGVTQVLLIANKGIVALDPTEGTLLWEHPWNGSGIVQPAFTDNGDILVGKQESGTSRLSVARTSGGWTVTERWTSNRLKPYFNDFVVHAGHAYGFDGAILACMDLENGERAWKGGRYGSGQMLLAADRDVLVVLSEKGALALVRATPEQFTELARVPAIEGKTWNHPALVDDILLVRNSQEMAAFRVPVR